MTDPDVPVLAVVGTGPGGASMEGVLGRPRNGVDLVVIVPARRLSSPHLRTPAVDERLHRCWTSCRCSSWHCTSRRAARIQTPRAA
jgi:glucosamine--fructose-6-phosphate aminotransferase (isomerizing)